MPLDAATNATGAVANALGNTGLASGLSSALSSVSNVLGAVGKFVKTLGPNKLPLANPLTTYASYNYVLSLGILTDDQLNNPDVGYMSSNASIPLICKDGGADPNNRIATAYGKFDFFMDNLSLSHWIANGPNIGTINFDIIEPYSMGMFMLACQTAAYRLGHLNWRDAPFLLMIEFRGERENGNMQSIPNTTRKIPIKFRDVSMKVSEKGSVYNCQAYAWSGVAYTDEYKTVKTDISISGKTVQEILQTGEKSLQNVMNQYYKDLQTKGKMPYPDEILILFPNNLASASSAAAVMKGNDGATAPGKDAASTKAIFDKLGVTRDDKTKTLVQSVSDCNELGQCKLKFNASKPGNTSFGKDDQVYNAKLGIYVRAKNGDDAGESDFKFSQGTDVINVINQVMMQSEFIDQTLNAEKVSEEGFKTWWRIDTQVYTVGVNDNYKTTGVKPKLVVYRVVPSSQHVGKVMAPNTKPPGILKLTQQAAKVYNYIYTGKNVDIINFDINFKTSFTAVMNDITTAGEVKIAAKTGDASEKTPKLELLAPGNDPSAKPGTNPTIVKYFNTGYTTDRMGGSSNDDQSVRAARVFHDAIHYQYDILNLNMSIIGDPYYIAQSGSGNYTATPTEYLNLNSDYTVNYQNGAVHIGVNFRSPLDINQTTGLYNFGGPSKSAPVMMFSGVFQLTKVDSKFSQGKFTQNLTGFRVPGQEFGDDKTATSAQIINTSNAKIDPMDPNGYGDG